MLPPIPQSLVPVTVQQDPVKPRPEVAPVAPPPQIDKEASLSLDQQEISEEAVLLAREEQRRRHRRARSEEGTEELEEDEAEAEEVFDAEPRQGRWVDVQV